MCWILLRLHSRAPHAATRYLPIYYAVRHGALHALASRGHLVMFKQSKLYLTGLKGIILAI